MQANKQTQACFSNNYEERRKHKIALQRKKTYSYMRSLKYPSPRPKIAFAITQNNYNNYHPNLLAECHQPQLCKYQYQLYAEGRGLGGT